MVDEAAMHCTLPTSCKQQAAFSINYLTLNDHQQPALTRNISAPAPIIRSIPRHPNGISVYQPSSNDQSTKTNQTIKQSTSNNHLSLLNNAQLGASIARPSTAPPTLSQSVLDCIYQSINQSIDHTRFSPAEAHLLRLRKFQYMNQLIVSDSEPVEILPRLYLGSIGGACNSEWLQKHSITHILTVGNHLPIFHSNKFEYFELIVQDAKQENISRHFDRCLRFIERGRGGVNCITTRPAVDKPVNQEVEEKCEPVSQSPDFDCRAQLSQANSQSNKQSRHDGNGESIGTGTMIHCFAGRSRSVTILLAYLLALVHSHSVDHADVAFIRNALRQQSTNQPSCQTPDSSSSKDNQPDLWKLPNPPVNSDQTITQSDNETIGQSDILPLRSLFEFVKSSRPSIKPNPGFIYQLLQFERELILMKQNDRPIAQSFAESDHVHSCNTRSGPSINRSANQSNDHFIEIDQNVDEDWRALTN